MVLTCATVIPEVFLVAESPPRAIAPIYDDEFDCDHRGKYRTGFANIETEKNGKIVVETSTMVEKRNATTKCDRQEGRMLKETGKHKQEVVKFATPLHQRQKKSTKSKQKAEEIADLHLQDAIEESHARTTDFRLPDDKRTFQVIVNAISYYIYPESVIYFAPLFAQYVIRKDLNGTPHFEVDDVSIDDVSLLLGAICPVEFGLFPKPVNELTFSQLARLSHQLHIKRLRQACECFVATMPFSNSNQAPNLIRMLDAAWCYELNLKTTARLLEGILGLGISSSCHRDTDLRVAILIVEAHAEYQSGAFYHSDMLPKLVHHGMPCRTCRSRWSSTHALCRQCRHVICVQCTKKPCKTSVEKFVSVFRLIEWE